MFLKRERPVTDDFAIQKISGCEGNMQYCINFNISPNLAFQNIPIIFDFFPTKSYFLLADRGFAPPPSPLTELPAKNVIFFTVRLTGEQ